MSKKNRLHRKSNKMRFGGIPLPVFEHPDYQALSGSAAKLLMDFACQYYGKNNGDLTAAYSVLKPRGWKSKGTISSAVNELLERNLITKTREGRFQNPGATCALYALNWYPIDECHGKLDVAPTRVPPRAFSAELSPTPSPKNGQGSIQDAGRVRLRDGKGRFISVQNADPDVDAA